MNNELKTFRHEFKYLLNINEMYKIRDKLRKILTVDRNIDGYMVRSLYFDSIDDVDYMDKGFGVRQRKKIRLRIYDPNDTKVKLEIKKKDDIHQLKKSLWITKDQARELINGNYGILLDIDNSTAKEIYLVLSNNYYRPKTIIEYQRMAFITSTTTRITFDFNIRATSNCAEFFEKNINYNNIMCNDQAVLEIKFDRYLEDYIGKIINKYVNLNSSVSKYYLSRNKVG